MKAGDGPLDRDGRSDDDVVTDSRNDPDATPDADPGGSPDTTSGVTQESLGEGAGAFCNACGWRNPPGANFCSQCGAKLQKISNPRTTADTSGAGSPGTLDRPRPPAPPPTGTAERAAPPSPAPPPDTDVSEHEEADSTAGMGRQVIIIVGAGILFVIALYMITVMSAENNRTSGPQARSTAAAAVEEPPLAEQFRPRETELQDQLQDASQSDAVDIRRDLMDLYLAANRIDLAAGEAERVAELTNTENDWAIAGNLYYDVMEGREDASRSTYAKRAIAAYDRALAINPDNLDIRTDMAIAYMYDPDNPMMAIQETNRVLEQDSLHIQANFNRGVMLANINRIDQAVEQFEKVKRIIGDESNPIYQRADQAIESVQGAVR